MNFQFFIVLTVLKNVYSYKSDRKPQSIPSMYPLNLKVDSTPARYKVANKNNYDTTSIMSQSVPLDYFPAVEFPTTAMESSKPFYINTSPFPNEVKATFELLAKKNKAPVDYSFIKDEIINAKNKLQFMKKLAEEAQLASSADNKTNVDVMTDTSPIDKLEHVLQEELYIDWPTTEVSSEQESDAVLDIMEDFNKVLTSLNQWNFTSDDQIMTANECLNTLNNMQRALEELQKMHHIQLNDNSFPLAPMEQKLSHLLIDTLDTEEDEANNSLSTDTIKDDIITPVEDVQ